MKTRRGKAGGGSALGLLVVHHFYGFVGWARGKTADSCEEMGTLPDAARL